MNEIDLTVTKVLSKPYFNYMWSVDVMAEAWGSEQKTTVHVDSEQEANDVSVGYVFKG